MIAFVASAFENAEEEEPGRDRCVKNAQEDAKPIQRDERRLWGKEGQGETYRVGIMNENETLRYSSLPRDPKA